MSNTLPSHVQGWQISGNESSCPLTVVKAQLWFGGWHFDAGTIDDQLTKVDPKIASAWLVESDDTPGLTFMTFKTERGPWDQTFRAAAALLYFCIKTGELGPEHRLSAPIGKVDPPDESSLIYLRNLGFSATYTGSDLIADPVQIHNYVADRFPEFSTARPLPTAEPE